MASETEERRFDGRVALVTGASGGIGRPIAQRLAAAGVTVNALAPALITDTGMLPGEHGGAA